MTPMCAWPVHARRASMPSVTGTTPRPLRRSRSCSPPRYRTWGAPATTGSSPRHRRAGLPEVPAEGRARRHEVITLRVVRAAGSLAVGLSLVRAVRRGPQLPTGPGTAAVQPPSANAGQNEQGGADGDRRVRDVEYGWEVRQLDPVHDGAVQPAGGPG